MIKTSNTDFKKENEIDSELKELTKNIYTMKFEVYLI